MIEGLSPTNPEDTNDLLNIYYLSLTAMSPSESPLAVEPAQDIAEDDPAGGVEGKTVEAHIDEISQISADSICAIEGNTALDFSSKTRPRTKAIKTQYGRFSHPGVVSASGLSAGGGDGSGGDGKNRKDEEIDIDELIRKTEETSKMPLGEDEESSAPDKEVRTSAEETPIPKSNAEKRHSNRPSAVDAEKVLNKEKAEYAEKVLKNELEEYARQNGLKYIDIDKSTYAQALEDFKKIKWNPGRITTIKDLKDHLEKERRRLKFYLDTLELASQKHLARIVSVSECTPEFLELSLRTFEDDVDAANVQLVTRTQEKYMGGGSFERLVHMKSRVIETLCSPDLLEQMRIIMAQLLCSYRYNIESLRETYRSRSLTTESVMQLGGFKDKTDVFFTGSGPSRRLRRHVDFGCGDGEILVQLADDMVDVEKKELKNKENATNLSEQVKISAKVSRDMLENFHKQFQGDMYWIDYERNIRARILRAYFNHFFKEPQGDRDEIDFTRKMDKRTDEAVERKFNRAKFEEDLRQNIIGIDQSAPFVARLASKGIGAVKGDICVNPKKLKSSTGIDAGSVDVVYSTLTFDRAKSKNYLALNISRALNRDGIAILGLKGGFTMTNDGHGGIEDPINYGTPGDWDLESVSASEMLDKLIPKLVQCGLQPTSLAMHKSLVISSDCETDESKPNFGPQEYDLVMLVCKKV